MKFIISLLLLTSCTQTLYVHEKSSDKVIYCDQVQIQDKLHGKDSTSIQPVTFEFVGKDIKHTDFFDNCTSRIIEKTNMGVFVYACNGHYYMVTYSLTKGGYIRFEHPERVLIFRILNVIKS